MSFDQARRLLQTLRFRLTLWNTTVVLILLVVNVAGIHLGLEFTQTQMVDEFLSEELDSAVLTWNLLGGPSPQLHNLYNQRSVGHPRRRLFIQLIDASDRLEWSSEQAPAEHVLPAHVLPFDIPSTIGEIRILCCRVQLPEGRPMTLRVGCWLGHTQGNMQRFTKILVAVGVLLMLAAPLGGYLLAYRATRPLARIIRIAKRLQPAHLEERLPIRGTRDEVDQLSLTINDLLDRIAVYLQQSRDFTANAAHELRSPLTALQSSLEIALNADRSMEEYKEVLAVLLEECGQMRLLVNQLLLLAEGDAGRLRLHAQTLRLDEIVASSLEMFQAVAESAGVELIRCRLEPVAIHGDGSQLWQVVNNLLDNAIKFTPAPGRVSLDFYLEAAGHECVLEVADTGLGIAPQDLPHVFERFYQGDKARQREIPSRGSGLGLSICQAVVMAHGGTIQVASTLGRGTTFTVRLPDCERPEPTDKRKSSSEPAA